MDNIIEIKNALDTLKPLLNASQVSTLNQMLVDAITSYHEGQIDEKIDSDLSALNIIRSEFIFNDSPF